MKIKERIMKTISTLNCALLLVGFLFYPSGAQASVVALDQDPATPPIIYTTTTPTLHGSFGSGGCMEEITILQLNGQSYGINPIISPSGGFSGCTRSWTYNVLSPLPNGTYSPRVVYSGNLTVDYPNAFTIDAVINQPPTTPLLSSPANGAIISDNTPYFNWDPSTDPDGDTIGYTFKFEGIGVNNQYPVPTPAVTVGPFEDGEYTWQVMAWDSNNNLSSWSEVRTITIDTINPIISEETADPTPFSPMNLDGVKDISTLNYDISEDAFVSVDIVDESDVLIKTLLVDVPRLEGSNNEIWDGKDNSNNYVMDGIYTFKINAVDYALNSAVQETTMVRVDNTAPVIADMSDIKTNVPVELKGSATDYGTEINYKWTMVDGPVGGVVTFVNDIDPETQVSVDIDGLYTLRLTATDMAGNSSTKDIKLTWDTTVGKATNLKSTVGENSITLNWTNPTDSDLTGLKVYRSTVSGELGTLLATLNEDVTTYKDSTAVFGLTYYYTVVTVDDDTNEAKSAQVSGLLPLVAPTALTPVSVAAASTTYSNRKAFVEDSETQGEVKSDITEGNNQPLPAENEDKALPAFGIFVLILLVLIGLYLLYLQKPEWFNWLFFWKKKKKPTPKKK